MTVAPKGDHAEEDPGDGDENLGDRVGQLGEVREPDHAVLFADRQVGGVRLLAQQDDPRREHEREGTIALFSDSENAFTPVSKGSDLAIPLAAYAATATGGVMSAITPK